MSQITMLKTKYLTIQVDFVVVVFQKQSDFGLPCSDKLIPTLQRLEKSGLH